MRIDTMNRWTRDCLVVGASLTALLVLSGCHGAARCSCSEGALPRLVASTSSTGSMLVGADPLMVHVDGAPSVILEIEEAGEYQIDAQGTLDASMLLYRDEQLLGEDDDSGEGTNARLVLSLEPGTYTVVLREHRGRPMAVQLQARRLSPLPTVGSVAPGQEVTVQVPSAGNARAASREIALTIAEADDYQLDATSPGDRDAELALVQDGHLIQQDSDSGDGYNARIRARLEPGTYALRVWDYGLRDSSITVSVDTLRAIAARPQPALNAVGSLSVGQPVVVELPQASTALEGTRALTLNVTEAGVYQLDATSNEDRDAELSLLQQNIELLRDSDSGEGVNARIERELAPGEYEVRVWEYQHRPAPITVTITRR